MKYWAIFHGAGEGCDHTISCNIATIKLEATNDEEVYNEIEDHLYGEESWGEGEIEKVEVIKGEYFLTIDTEEIRAKENEIALKERIKEQNKKDKKEYERLKKKFEHQ